jgi:S-formylglutathione hydrolase
MTFSIFLPPQDGGGGKLPVVWYLSDLTCTHANVTEKGEYRAACAEHGLIFVAPDTSPRGEDVPNDEAYDFGQGAGFYVDATQEPWSKHFRSVSAFAPIVAPGQVPWGEKALSGYLGEDRSAWRKHDAVALLEDGARVDEILVDVGTADPFIEKELRPELLEAACADAGIALILRRQPGYDHSYYFISTFMADHLAWHAERLRRG